MKKYKTIDLFSGLGGIRRGYELTGRFSNVLSADIDKYACQVYKHLYNEDSYNDVTSEEFKNKVENIEYDVLLGGFPCQAFSIAGLQKGFADETRGTLFFDIADIIKRTKPKSFMLENVEGLLKHEKGNTFKTIIKVLNELNYKVVGVDIKNGEIKYDAKNLVRSTKDFGIPQKRARIFIMGFRNDIIPKNYKFPNLPDHSDEKIYRNLYDLLESKVDSKYYLSDKLLTTLKNHKASHASVNSGFGYIVVNEGENPVSNTIMATGGSGKERNLIRQYVKEYDNLWEKIDHLINSNEQDLQTSRLDYLDRVITTGNVTTYLKIAEGCSNRCTYCAIPYIRGAYISRPFEKIIEEAKSLAEKGYKEIIVIAQDTTKYGMDLYGKSRLAELLQELSKIDGIKWIRFLYAYPESITDELIQTVKNNDKICKYFDIPIQHISDPVLKRMNRKTTGENIKNIIKKIKKEIPEAILRTTLIVGFPGETEEDFEKLMEFVEEANFDKLGAFKYSKEEGTPAAKLPEQIHYKTKQKRLDAIMTLAQKISKQKLQEKIGNEYEMLVENKTFDGRYYCGRTYMDIPEEDGLIFIPNTKPNLENTWIKVKVTDVKNYDLIGELK